MQTFRETTPAQTHLPASAGQREDDPTVGKSCGRYAQQQDREIESRLHILCRVAAAASNQQNLTSYCIRRHPGDFMDSTTTTIVGYRVITQDTVHISAAQIYTSYRSITMVQNATLSCATSSAFLEQLTRFQPAVRSTSAQVMTSQLELQLLIIEHPWILSNIQTSASGRARTQMLARLPELTHETSAAGLSAPSQPQITNVDGVAGYPGRVSTAEYQDPKRLKRRWEQEDSNLEIKYSSSNGHRSKQPKIYCGCDVNRNRRMALSIDSINEVLERMDAIAKRKDKLDRTLMRLILDDSNRLSNESRNALDEAVFGLINQFLDKSKEILNDLKGEIRREGAVYPM